MAEAAVPNDEDDPTTPLANSAQVTEDFSRTIDTDKTDHATNDTQKVDDIEPEVVYNEENETQENVSKEEAKEAIGTEKEEKLEQKEESDAIETENIEEKHDATEDSRTHLSVKDGKNAYGSVEPLPSMSMDDEIGPQLSQELMKNLEKHLPYFHEFLNKKEKSVLNMNDYNKDPEGYLQAILAKYTVDHPKSFDDMNNETEEKMEHQELRPWIGGVLEKLMPALGILGQQVWKTRLFRLFDEALVWFPEEGMFSKWLHRKEKYMRPLGVLPLAMITSIRTHDLDKFDEASEDELLIITLEIGNEGIFVLRCSDFRQRIKWLECLHAAVFNVTRPLFAQKEGIWRIAEDAPPTDVSKQLTTDNMDLRPRHVRMGTSLLVTVGRLSIHHNSQSATSTPTPNPEINNPTTSEQKNDGSGRPIIDENEEIDTPIAALQRIRNEINKQNSNDSRSNSRANSRSSSQSSEKPYIEMNDQTLTHPSSDSSSANSSPVQSNATTEALMMSTNDSNTNITTRVL